MTFPCLQFDVALVGNRAPAQSARDGGWSCGFSQFAEKAEALVSLSDQRSGVEGPGELLCDMHTQKRSGAHPLRCSSTIDGQRGML